MTEREFAIEVVARLQAAGFQALWAGGCVRDEVLGLPPADYDVATDARPEQVQGLFKRSHAFGANFGVVEVLGPRAANGEWLTVEVATFRNDGVYSDERRPDSVTFSSPEEDAKRRDFTINGMFFDPIACRVIDYVGGKADLDDRILRAIGNPAARFAEDKLRVLRAVRMAARFDLTIDPATFEAARASAERITVVSAERIAEELRKILTNRRRARGFTLLREFALVERILNELVPALSTAHSAERSEWDQIVKILEVLSGSMWPEPHAVSFPLGFATILSPLKRLHNDSVKLVESICRRLRLSNEETARIGWLVSELGSLNDAPNMLRSRLYPILIHPGIGELVALHRAVAAADGIDASHVEFCERVLNENPTEVLDPTPILTGDDLRRAGMTPGPKFKLILERVRAAQLDGLVSTLADALRLATDLAESKA